MLRTGEGEPRERDHRGPAHVAAREKACASGRGHRHPRQKWRAEGRRGKKGEEKEKEEEEIT